MTNKIKVLPLAVLALFAGGGFPGASGSVSMPSLGQKVKGKKVNDPEGDRAYMPGNSTFQGFVESLDLANISNFYEQFEDQPVFNVVNDFQAYIQLFQGVMGSWMGKQECSVAIPWFVPDDLLSEDFSEYRSEIQLIAKAFFNFDGPVPLYLRYSTGLEEYRQESGLSGAWSNSPAFYVCIDADYISLLYGEAGDDTQAKKDLVQYLAENVFNGTVDFSAEAGQMPEDEWDPTVYLKYFQAFAFQSVDNWYPFLYENPSLIYDGETARVFVNVDDPLTIDQILANVSAEDLLGKEVTVSCTEQEKAKYLKDTIGTYTVTVTATDDYGQTGTCYLEIHVVDTVAPVITQKKQLNFAAGDMLRLADMGDYIAVTDNGTDHGGTIGEATYAIDGQPFSSDRTWGPSDVGNHTLKVTVADSSGNTATKEFSINVLDTQAPVITMRDGGDGNLLIGLSRVLSFTQEDFLQLFTAIDNVTPQGEIVLDVEGSFIPSKVGNYDIVVTARDRAGNVGRYTCHVTVDADLPPVFILSDALVGATADNPLSSSQIQSIVTNAIYAGRSVANVLIDDTGYQDNRTTPGSYPVSYSVQVLDADGSLNTETGSMTIRVSEGDGGSGEELTAWEKFCRWWTDGWQCFCNWFRGVFTKFEWDCWITNEEWDDRFPAEEI